MPHGPEQSIFGIHKSLEPVSIIIVNSCGGVPTPIVINF